MTRWIDSGKSGNTVPGRQKTAAPMAGFLATRLRDLLHECVVSPASEEGARITEAAWLLHGAARAGLIVPSAAFDPEAVAELAARGGPESAVLALMGPRSAFMLSRGGTGTCLATAVLPCGMLEASAEAGTPALALLAAHISALLIAGDPQDRTESAFAGAGPRLN